MLSILQTKLFQICSCLGNLHAVEPSLQPELLNHFLHGGDAGGTRHGAREGRAGRLSGRGRQRVRRLTPTILTGSPPTHKLSTAEHRRLHGIWRLQSPEFLEQEPRLGRRSVQRTQRMDKLNHHFTRLQAHELVKAQHGTRKSKLKYWLK